MIMSTVKKNRRFITIRFTHEEVQQLSRALGNNSGDGDWLEYLSSCSTKKEIRGYLSMIDKVNAASGIEIIEGK